MSAKLTKWFPETVKPVHVGVYMTAEGGDEGYQFWNGSYFGSWSYSISAARNFGKKKSFFQNVKWRGLAVKP